MRRVNWGISMGVSRDLSYAQKVLDDVETKVDIILCDLMENAARLMRLSLQRDAKSKN